MHAITVFHWEKEQLIRCSVTCIARYSLRTLLVPRTFGRLTGSGHQIQARIVCESGYDCIQRVFVHSSMDGSQIDTQLLSEYSYAGCDQRTVVQVSGSGNQIHMGLVVHDSVSCASYTIQLGNLLWASEQCSLEQQLWWWLRVTLKGGWREKFNITKALFDRNSSHATAALCSDLWWRTIVGITRQQLMARSFKGSNGRQWSMVTLRHEDGGSKAITHSWSFALCKNGCPEPGSNKQKKELGKWKLKYFVLNWTSGPILGRDTFFNDGYVVLVSMGVGIGGGAIVFYRETIVFCISVEGVTWYEIRCSRRL